MIRSYLNDAKCSDEKWNRIFKRQSTKGKPLKNAEEIKDISLVCQHCGTKNNWAQHEISTWYAGHCDICGDETIVTEFRDFFYGKKCKNSIENN